MPLITIDESEYETEQLPDDARAQLAILQACDSKVQQLQIELSMIQAARTAYGRALKDEIRKFEEDLLIT